MLLPSTWLPWARGFDYIAPPVGAMLGGGASSRAESSWAKRHRNPCSAILLSGIPVASEAAASRSRSSAGRLRFLPARFSDLRLAVLRWLAMDRDEFASR